MSRVLLSPVPHQAFPGPPAFPPGVAFFRRGRGVSLSSAARRLCPDLASNAGQRLWMPIAGSSADDTRQIFRSSRACMSKSRSIFKQCAGETGGGTNIRTHADPVQHSCRPTSAPVLNRSRSSFFLFSLLSRYGVPLAAPYAISIEARRPVRRRSSGIFAL